MLDTLEDVMQKLPEMVKDITLWDSLIINRRKPFTYRAFHILNNGVRICLHKFDPCERHDAFFHPHPWPSAMRVMRGKYRMEVGASPDYNKPPMTVMETVLSAGSTYSSDEPNFWHSVQPLETCYSVMVNSAPWSKDVAHFAAPTTKGKDLDKMTDEQLRLHLLTFENLLLDAGY